MPGASGITGSGLLLCGAVWCLVLMRCGSCQKWDEYQVFRGGCSAHMMRCGVGAWRSVAHGAGGMNGVHCGVCSM